MREREKERNTISIVPRHEYKTTLTRSKGNGTRHSRENRLIDDSLAVDAAFSCESADKGQEAWRSPCIDPLRSLARTPSSISWRSRWLMLPNKLSRKTCRSRGISRACTAPFIYPSHPYFPRAWRRRTPARRHPTHTSRFLTHQPTPVYTRRPCIHACIHTLRRWYPSNPIYFDFAINVIASAPFWVIIHRPALPEPSSSLTKD